MRWVDANGTPREKSSGVRVGGRNRDKAMKVAAAFEDELNSPFGPITIDEFDRRYRAEHLSGLSAASLSKWATAIGYLIEAIRPAFLADVDASSLSRYVQFLRSRGLREATIAANLRTLVAGLRWASRAGLIEHAPTPPKLARATGRRSRSRPITLEEFERMHAAASPAYRELFELLWLSGLRLDEALRLRWWVGELAVDHTDGIGWILRIQAEGEKGRQDRLLPVPPDFAAWLAARVDWRGRGRVVRHPDAKRKTQAEIARIAEAANVRTAPGKWASAHDLRRSFGTRWAKVLRPAELAALMRHSSIQTTMSYYVEFDAAELAESLARAFRGGIGGTPRVGVPNETTQRESS